MRLHRLCFAGYLPTLRRIIQFKQSTIFTADTATGIAPENRFPEKHVALFIADDSFLYVIPGCFETTRRSSGTEIRDLVSGVSSFRAHYWPASIDVE